MSVYAPGSVNASYMINSGNQKCSSVEKVSTLEAKIEGLEAKIDRILDHMDKLSRRVKKLKYQPGGNEFEAARERFTTQTYE